MWSLEDTRVLCDEIPYIFILILILVLTLSPVARHLHYESYAA